MTHSQSLAVLLEREQAERDQLLAAFQQAQAHASAATAQAEQLQAYRGEYQQRWQAQLRSGSANMDILRCYQGFHERLDQAIDQQRQVARHAEAQQQRTRAALTAQELRVASVRRLIERRQADVRQAADRVDQKHSDEVAQRSAGTASWRHDGGLLQHAGAH